MVQEELDIKLSIIIPVYNTADYLERCIESVLNCFPNNENNNCIEILILNDGSLDNSQQIIDLYTAKYPFIRGYFHQNMGLSETRNRGISLSKGEYLWFIDSDDYIKQIDLSSLVSFISKECIDICYFKYREGPKVDIEKLDLNFDLVNVLSGNDFFSKIEFTGHAWLYIFKKSIIGDIRFDKGKYYEDIAFTIEIFTKANKFYFIDQVIYEYYVNPDSIIRKKNNYLKDYKLCEDLVFSCNRIIDFLNKNAQNLSNVKRQVIEKKIEYLVYYLLTTLIFKKIKYKDIKKIISNLNFKEFKYLMNSKEIKQKIISRIFNSFLFKKKIFFCSFLF